MSNGGQVRRRREPHPMNSSGSARCLLQQAAAEQYGERSNRGEQKGQRVCWPFRCAVQGVSRGWIHDPTDEQNGASLDIADEEDEGVIDGDLNGLHRRCLQLHLYCGGRCGFGARFVHGDE
jgi:hypothetical protein